MKLHQQPFDRNSSRRNSRWDSRRNSRRCSFSRARTKPKAGTGTNCNLNAQEQDNQHIELQKQHPQMAEQAPPHEIASAALNRKNSRKNSRSNSRCCSYPTARTKPKAGTGTNCNLNAQEQDKQHIELQKQHPQMAEQAPPHEIASAALNRKNSRKNSRSNSRCCSYPTARTKPKAGTGTNCHLNQQERDKQHIEVQKQHPDLPEQAPPHESAPAVHQQKHQQGEALSQGEPIMYKWGVPQNGWFTVGIFFKKWMIWGYHQELIQLLQF